MRLFGAEEGTRTPTPLRALDPESSASTNFATSARGEVEDTRPSAAPSSVAHGAPRPREPPCAPGHELLLANS